MFRHWYHMLQASQLPWREPSRGFNFNFPSFGKGVNIDKIAEDFKVPVYLCKPSNPLHCSHHIIAGVIAHKYRRFLGHVLESFKVLCGCCLVVAAGWLYNDK